MSANIAVVSTQGPSPEDAKVPTVAPSKDDEEAEALLNEYTTLEQSEKVDNAKSSEKSDEKVSEKVVDAEKVVEKEVMTSWGTRPMTLFLRRSQRNAVMKKTVVNDRDDDMPQIVVGPKIVNGPKVLQVDASSFLASMMKDEMEKAKKGRDDGKEMSRIFLVGFVRLLMFLSLLS
jgi:hypothetical protein